MSLQNVVDWLTWSSSGERPPWLDSFGSFLNHASDQLGHVLSSLRLAAPARMAEMEDLLAQATDEIYVRFATAPEITNRLFWGRPSAETLDYFVGTLKTELAVAGLIPTGQGPGWSALGDVCVLSDGRVDRPFVIDGLMPIDVGSPHAETLANSDGFVEVGTPETRAFTGSELAGLGRSLTRTGDTIRTVSAEVDAFIKTFNRVVILQKDPGAPDLFASGSTGQYIGRAFLANPHLPALDDAQFADALVHEAIHGLLYMEETLDPWVLEPSLYSFKPVLKSPWSGNLLAVRPFLQACFVWFGLAHFFAEAVLRSVFLEGRAQRRLRVASSGFLHERFEVILRDYVKLLSPAVVAAIISMQDRIADAFRSAS